MCTKCELGVDQEYLAAIRDMVGEYGWVVADLAGEVCEAGVFPAIAYTIGLTELGHPELVITGRMSGQAADVLDRLASRVWDGMVLAAGDRWNVGGLELELLEVTGGPDWLRWPTRVHPGLPVRGIQAVWADGQGRFPWEQQIPDDLTQTIFGTFPCSDTAA